MTTAIRTRWQQRIARYDDFVGHVQTICRENPDLRAGLRRSIGRTPQQASRAHAVVGPFVLNSPWAAEERALYTVAALIAVQPRSSRDADEEYKEPEYREIILGNEDFGPDTSEIESDASLIGNHNETSSSVQKAKCRRINLGESMAYAVPEVLSEISAERRLHILAKQSIDGMHRQLPGTIRALRGKYVPVDWAQLIADLTQLEHDPGLVSKRWLQAFYRTLYLKNERANESSESFN